MENAYLLSALRKQWNLEGSVIVRGMIFSAGVGTIVGFHGNIKASVYWELLRLHALPHLHKRTVETPIFMHDNGLCHKAKTVMGFLEEGIAVMKWPPHRSDMNPLDNVWKIIGEKAQNRNPQNIDDLWGFLKEEWESITVTFSKKLIGSSDWGLQWGNPMQNKYWIFL